MRKMLASGSSAVIAWFWCAVMAVTACSSKGSGQGHTDQVDAAPRASSSSLGIPSFSESQGEIVEDVSVIDLLSRPGQYDGKKVQVVGAFSAATNGLYVTREHAAYNLPEFGVALRLAKCDGTPLKNMGLYDLPMYNLEYVRIKATFSTTVTGHVGEFPSGLCEPTDVRRAGVGPQMPKTTPGKPASSLK